MKLSDVKKLHQKKYRMQSGYYLVEGEHLVLELHKAFQSSALASNIVFYCVSELVNWVHELSASFEQAQPRVIEVSDKQMAQISDTKSPQGVLAIVPFTDKANSEANAKRCIYLHEVQDPGNLGTILRSLTWFGDFSLILSPNSVDPYNAKVVRSSMGAIFHTPIELDVSLQDLQARFDRFAYLDMQGTSISDSSFASYDCYLFGNEARGVPNNALRDCEASAYTIQGSGKIDSLNLASAVNICAFQLSCLDRC